MELNTRKIEFRGRNGGKWFYGSLIKVLPRTGYNGYKWECGIHAPSIYDNTAHLNWNLDVQYVETETIGQFTGMLDKNGNKIYEGDIIEYQVPKRTDRAVVIFEKGMFCAKIPFNGGVLTYSLQTLIENSNPRVIGNVHDNPKLLKAQDDNTKEDTAAGL